MRIILIIYICLFLRIDTLASVFFLFPSMTLLTQACSDILYKNMSYTDESVYFLYDTQSPLAGLLSDAWRSVLGSIDSRDIAIREFLNPPQPLYRG